MDGVEIVVEDTQGSEAQWGSETSREGSDKPGREWVRRVQQWVRGEERRIWGGGVIVTMVFVALFIWTVGPGSLLNTKYPIEGDQVSQNWWLQEFARRFWGLFTGGHLFGWTDDFGAGQPFGYFYFPLPAVVYSGLDVVLPGGVAAKLVQLIGLALVPWGVYQAGKILGGRQSSYVFASAAVSIGMYLPQRYPVGGDAASTLIGEYSYAWGLGLGLVAMAMMARIATDAGGNQDVRWARTGVIAGAAVLSHVNAVFALAGGGAVYLLAGLLAGRRGVGRSVGARTGNLLKASSVGVGIAAFWLLPMWSMRGEIQGNNKLADRSIMYWFAGWGWKAVLVAGVVGLLLGCIRGSRVGRMMTVLLGGAFVVYEVLTEWHSFELWSGRCMPVIYTGLLVGVGELAAFIYERGSRRMSRIAAITVAVGVLVGIGIYQQYLVVEDSPEWRERSTSTWAGLGRGERSEQAAGRVDALIEKLAGLEPGRILYSTSAEGYLTYGTKDLNGEIIRRGAASGGASTFFHEGNRGRFTLAYGTSGSMTRPSGIEPGGVALGIDDFEAGVEMMRQFGIRYYIIGEPELHERASQEPRLRLVGSVGRVEDGANQFFEIYEIEEAAIVEAVRREPGIVSTLPLWGETTWDGKVKQWLARLGKEPYTGIHLVEDAPMSVDWVGKEEYGEAGVRVVEVSDERIEFTVQNTGIPVVIRMGYSPNWEVSGGEGVYHAAPHAMIVVPRESTVVVQYRHPVTERLGMLITLGVLGWLGWGAVRGRRVRSRMRPTGEPI